MLISTECIKITHSELLRINFSQKKNACIILGAHLSICIFLRKIKSYMEVKYCNPQQIVVITAEILYREKLSTQIRTNQPSKKAKFLTINSKNLQTNNTTLSKFTSRDFFTKENTKNFARDETSQVPGLVKMESMVVLYTLYDSIEKWTKGINKEKLLFPHSEHIHVCWKREISRYLFYNYG